MNLQAILEHLSNLAYPISLSLGFFFLYILIKLKVKGVAVKRVASIKRRNILDAVETSHPEGENLDLLKEQGVAGLENRFAFINTSLPIILIMLWGVLVSIPYIGKIPGVYITIIAAISSVVFGMALRPFLENLFSGIVISFFKSIRIGDTVIIDGHYGMIEEIGLTYSILKRWDWYRIIIPNSALLNKEIQNLSLKDAYIWAHVEFYIEPEADITKVEQLALEAAKNSPHYTVSEAPSFWVMSMDKEAIKCWVAAWAPSPLDAWELRHEIRTRLIKSLQQVGIGFNCHKIKR